MTVSQQKTDKALSAFSQSFPWAVWILSLLPLLVWLYFSFFSRYLADDYSTSSIVLKKGFWEAQVYWYNAWTGKYLYTFLTSLVELGGVPIVPWLCIFSMLTGMISL